MISMMEIMGIDRARARLGDLAEKALAGPIILTRNGEPAVVLIAPEDYSSMVATIELMSDPGFHKEMAAIESDLMRGETTFIPHEEIERRLQERFNRSRGG
jgi:prevent-host-death family protein